MRKASDGCGLFASIVGCLGCCFFQQVFTVEAAATVWHQREKDDAPEQPPSFLLWLVSLECPLVSFVCFFLPISFGFADRKNKNMNKEEEGRAGESFLFVQRASRW